MSTRRLFVRAKNTILILLLFGLLFVLWPGTSQFDPVNWKGLSLSHEETLNAIENAKKAKYLRSIGYYKSMFPASEIQVSMEQYVWLITERVKLIAVLLLCVSLMLTMKRVNLELYYDHYNREVLALKVGIALFAYDLLDHLITYNEPYFGVVGANLIAIVIFMVYYVYDSWKANYQD